MTVLGEPETTHRLGRCSSLMSSATDGSEDFSADGDDDEENEDDEEEETPPPMRDVKTLVVGAARKVMIIGMLNNRNKFDDEGYWINYSF